MDEEIKKLEKQLKDLKDKKRKELQEQRAAAKKEKEEMQQKIIEARKKKEFEIPDNMLLTKEYGWIQILPCGPGDYVYSVESHIHQIQKCLSA